MGFSVSPSAASISLSAVLTATPTGATPDGYYTQIGGTPPAGIAKGDIFRWASGLAILIRSYALAPASISTSSDTYIKRAGSWSNLPGTTSIVSSAVTIGATTTAPTKGVPYADNITLVDNSSGWCDVAMDYAQTNATGSTAGSGTYLFSLPGGYKFDTIFHTLNSQVAYINGYADVSKLIPANAFLTNFGSQGNALAWVMPHSATQFKLAIVFSISGSVSPFYFAASNYFEMTTAAGIGYKAQFRFKKG